jgi:hypothetical protein
MWKGVLWIATSAMSAFSHEEERRTSFVCAPLLNQRQSAWLGSSAATELSQCGDNDRFQE